MVGIDTVTLSIPIKDFAIMEPSRFTPHAAKVLNAEPKDLGRGRYTDASCNPFKQDTNSFGYLPYLTLYTALRSGGYATELRVQFSAPKIINGNNFDEISPDDFELICKKVLDSLGYYHINIYGGLETIKSANVAVVNYSKNFALTNFMTASQAVSEIRKCNVNAWKDVCECQYFNGGAGYKTHSKFHELAFYDKIAEHHRGKKNKPLFDTDTQLSFDLFEDKLQHPFEVLRYEIRLGNPRTIKWALDKVSLPTDNLKFNTLFSSNYSKAILQWHLEKMYASYPKSLQTSKNSDADFFSELYIHNPGRHISTLISAVGLRKILHEVGVRNLKDIVGPRGSPALMRLVNKYSNELNFQSEKPEVFDILRTQLDRFQPVYLKDYEK